jgi:ATP phosphoribosyltransferase regulatory subunit
MRPDVEITNDGQTIFNRRFSMSVVDRWLLPDGVDEVLPPQAAKMEAVRRQLLDLFQRWGYELVIPPMVEFLESLLTGSGHDVDLQTFKLIDQKSGRTLGLRADITPQVARIDAHSLLRNGPSRLCYAETVVHAQANDMLASRIPIRIGAELFGHEGSDSDIEIVSLMLESLKTIALNEVLLEIGDVNIYRLLIHKVGISEEDQQTLFNAIQRKAPADINTIIGGLGLPADLTDILKELPQLVGGKEVLARSREIMGSIPGINESIQRLESLADVLSARYPEVELHFDLSELRGYNYHTGIVFAAYLEGHGQVAKGGRYDHVGEVFGRLRPATGFDMDLKALAQIASIDEEDPELILVRSQPALSADDRDKLWRFSQQLREEGYQVVFELEDQAGENSSDCSGTLEMQNGECVIERTVQ